MVMYHLPFCSAQGRIRIYFIALLIKLLNDERQKEEERYESGKTGFRAHL